MSVKIVVLGTLVGCVWGACASLLLAWLERRGLSDFAERTFRSGPVVFRTTFDLNELGGRNVTEWSYSVVTTRLARFQFVGGDRILFLARRPVPSPGALLGQSGLLGPLKGTARVDGEIVRAEARLSPWIATFLGATALGVVLGSPTVWFLGRDWIFAAPFLPFGVIVVFVLRSEIRRAKLDAASAIGDIAAYLAGRTDLSRAYPASR